MIWLSSKANLFLITSIQSINKPYNMNALKSCRCSYYQPGPTVHVMVFFFHAHLPQWVATDQIISSIEMLNIYQAKECVFCPLIQEPCIKSKTSNELQAPSLQNCTFVHVQINVASVCHRQNVLNNTRLHVKQRS